MNKKRALELTIEVLRESGVSKNKYQLLVALLKSSDLEKGFTYSDLAQLLGIKDPAIEDSSKQKIKRQLKTLDEVQNEQSLIIAKKLFESGFEQIIKIENIQKGGGAGNTAIFSLTSHPFNAEDKSIFDTGFQNQRVGAVHYSLEKIEKLPLWGRPFQKVKIDGWKKGAYIALPLAVGLIPIPLMILFIINSEWINFIAAAMSATMLFKVIHPFYTVLDTGVIKSPQWLLPLRMAHALLITKKTETGRELILTQYKSLCPICEGQVHVVDGKHEFKGRLIGQCERSGREHLFSFDHITKVGFPLREPGYSELLKSVRLS
ncbi:MAG: hypothetical protein V7785_18040 [Bermanella sp.]